MINKTSQKLKMDVNLNITHCNSLPNLHQTNQLFRILQMNIHSLRNKHPQLEAEIELYEYPEVVVISETWLTEEIKNHYEISGYSSYHTTRIDGYGGLSIYII